MTFERGSNCLCSSPIALNYLSICVARAWNSKALAPRPVALHTRKAWHLCQCDAAIFSQRLAECSHLLIANDLISDFRFLPEPEVNVAPSEWNILKCVHTPNELAHRINNIRNLDVCGSNKCTVNIRRARRGCRKVKNLSETENSFKPQIIYE